jgi:hypothetical protein
VLLAETLTNKSVYTCGIEVKLMVAEVLATTTVDIGIMLAIL